MPTHRGGSDLELHDFEYRLWSGTEPPFRWECLLKGIPTGKGVAPDFCGGKLAHDRRSHTVPGNMIKAVNQGGSNVVCFSLKSRPKTKEWNRDVLSMAVYEKTGVLDATSGRYACDYHDQVFKMIDGASAFTNVPPDPAVPTLFALRAVLYHSFLTYRHWRLFAERSRYCFDKAAEFGKRYRKCNCQATWRRDGRADRSIAGQHKGQAGRFRAEATRLVSLVRDGDMSQVLGSQFFIPGPATVGGSMVFNQRGGRAVTCMVIPVMGGHYVYLTRCKGVRNAVAKLVTGLVMPSLSDAQRGQVLSELVMQQNPGIFITLPRWHHMERTGDAVGIRNIAQQMHSAPLRGFRALKDDSRVPNLFA